MSRPLPSLPDNVFGRAVRPFLILTGLALAWMMVTTLSEGEPLVTAVTRGTFRALVGGALAASLAYAVADPGPHVDSVPGLVRRFIVTWIVPGAWFAVGLWVTALLTVDTLASHLDEWGEQPWLLWIAAGAAVGSLAGAFAWRIWPPEALESDELAEERATWSKWAGAGFLVLVVVPILIAGGPDVETREEREQREMLEAGAQVHAMMQLEEMRAIAPPGTPATAYADSAAAHFAGHLAEWYEEPLTHRVVDPLLMGSPAVEVVFGEGVVQGVLPASGPPGGDSIPPAEAAERLGLPVEHPVFRLAELDRESD